MAHGPALPKVKVVNPSDLKDTDVQDLLVLMLQEMQRQTALLKSLRAELQDGSGDEDDDADVDDDFEETDDEGAEGD